MLFGGKRGARESSPLKPFVLRTREGYLVGLTMDPEQGSPCLRCVQGWLERRGLGSQPGRIEELGLRQNILADLLAENSPHVLYEVHLDGTVNRLNGVVFPLPDCVCSKKQFHGAPLDPNSNFTFSPIMSVKCARYVTPSGHLWLTGCVGQSPIARERVSTYGAGVSKADSRRAAIDAWLAQAGTADLVSRARQEPIPTECLQTFNADLLQPDRGPYWQASGAGNSYEEATLQALYGLTKQKTLQGYSSSGKTPMLIVGANNWIRQRVPYFLLQEYDMHLLFYPNSSPCWVVGLAAFSRTKSDARPLFAFAVDADINQALEGLLSKLLEWARPDLGNSAPAPTQSDSYSEKGFRLNMWWTHWIYRCSKIALKDVLHLEPYPRSVDFWRDYLRDGQPMVSVVPLNHADLPAGLRTLVELRQAKHEAAQIRRVVGIGTLSPFQDSVL